VHDLGVTVLLAEHRLERVVQYADRVVYLPGDGTVRAGLPEPMLASVALVPPIIELGRLAKWTPLPLSVRDARRSAASLRQELDGRVGPSARPVRVSRGVSGGEVVLDARGVVVRYGPVTAVAGADLTLRAGEVTALMGRNGSGKSSLLWALSGVGARQRGTVTTSGPVTLVPQTPSDLLYLDTVAAELAQADRESAPVADAVAARELLDQLTPGIEDGTDPRDLSEGQRLALVLAIQLRAAPRVVLLDEPTRGLDYDGKHALTRIVDQLAAAGRAVVIATHDVEFVATSADRVVVLADGDVVADGPAADVLVATPAFAPQVAKILAPLRYLTVAQVATALAGAP
jgi:energy-coupling factor transport system ATP-binding protein